MNSSGIRTIGAHWYSRPATLRECTEQSLDFLIKLSKYNPVLFSIWFQGGWSRKQALKHQIEFTYGYIKRLFSKRSMDDGYPEINYKFMVWNGASKDEESASLSIALGSTESKYFTNHCVINLPYEGEQHEFYKDKKNQAALINILKEHWNPEWIMVDEERLQLV